VSEGKRSRAVAVLAGVGAGVGATVFGFLSGLTGCGRSSPMISGAKRWPLKKALLSLTILLLSTVIPPAALAQDVDGEISGMVVDAAGKPLVGQRVQLRRPRAQGPGQVVVTTGANGAFTYTGLGPGRYEVELVREGRVVTRSGPIELAAGMMRMTGVIVIQPARSPTWHHTDRHVTKLPRVNAEQLLGAQGVATSFETLRAILKPGHRVVFAGRDSSRLAMAFARGGLWSGREVLVAEVTGERLVLVRRRLFRTEEIVLTEDAVRRIDIVDPTTKGGLLGAAVGGSLGLALILETRREVRSRIDCNLCPLGYMMGILMPVAGIGLGAAIDRMITERVYQGQPQTPRGTLTPLFGRGAIGVSAHISF
jgi:hypothetical protein